MTKRFEKLYVPPVGGRGADATEARPTVVARSPDRATVRRPWHNGRCPSTYTQLALAVLALLWGAGVVWGFGTLLRYGASANSSGEATKKWPASSQIRLDPLRFNLVMAAHPRCPCTRASIAELARIMTVCRNDLSAHVVFWKPDNADASWEQGHLWERALGIPGVEVYCDEGGAEARHFGAVTSGHVFLYSPDGELCFTGGITAARGHIGDNAGRHAIISCVSNEKRAGLRQRPEVDAQARGADATPLPETPVFGCPLERTPQKPGFSEKPGF